MEYMDDITKELAELDAKFLLSSQDRKGFKKPSASYVNELYDQVSKNTKATVVPIWLRPQLWTVAASLLIAIFSVYLIGANDQLTLEEINQEDVYTYIIDSEDIYSDDLFYIGSAFEEISNNDLGILDQSILDYLDDHIEDIDITELNSY